MDKSRIIRIHNKEKFNINVGNYGCMKLDITSGVWATIKKIAQVQNCRERAFGSFVMVENTISWDVLNNQTQNSTFWHGHTKACYINLYGDIITSTVIDKTKVH